MPIRKALAEALRGRSINTQDLGGNASTLEFAQAVSNRLA
jgi:isocitrate/isopropylmalate dehydrogenase